MSPRNEEEEAQFIVRPLGSRVSVLEFRQDTTDTKLDEVLLKLNELLELKHKGMGAIGLVGILFGVATGIAGVIATVIGFFSGR